MHNNESTDRGGSGTTPRLLLVISDLQVGGTERQVVALASALTKLNWAVTVYSFADGVSLRQQLERNGVSVVVVPDKLDLLHPSRIVRSLYALLGAIHLLGIMRTLRPRIVHCFLPAAYLIGAPAAFFAQMPVRVISRRSLNYYQRNAFIRSFERILHRSMRAVLGNSRSVIDQLKGEGVRQDQLGLIYNGIDLAAFANSGVRAKYRARLCIDADALVMCIVANLIPYKGHRDLIAALGLAAPNLPAGWRLLIVGRDDGIGRELKDQAVQLGLQENISFLGPRDDVAAILAASDIGVLCSHEEGFSNAILEGMAAGLPMVVTDVGGNAEAVVEGETGLVVPARDSQSLSGAIVRLAGDATLRAKLGAAGRQRAVEQFGMQKFVESHHRLYQALLAGKSASDVAGVGVSPNVHAKIQA